MIFRGLLLLPWLAASAAWAQPADILAGAPRTSLYVEASPADNDGRPGCDWYRSATQLINTDDPSAIPGCDVSIRIRGIINREGARYFNELVAHLEISGHRPGVIVLDSRGGDADAAIFISRLIREKALFRELPVATRLSESFDAVCFSACVVIFSAGYERSLEFNIDGNAALPSRLGIHGPGQFNRSAGAYDSSASNRGIVRVSRQLKDYFREIGVSEALVDDMFAVPFDEIRLLSREEVIAYGLYP